MGIPTTYIGTIPTPPRFTARAHGPLARRDYMAPESTGYPSAAPEPGASRCRFAWRAARGREVEGTHVHTCIHGLTARHRRPGRPAAAITKWKATHLSQFAWPRPSSNVMAPSRRPSSSRLTCLMVRPGPTRYSVRPVLSIISDRASARPPCPPRGTFAFTGRLPDALLP